MLVGSRVGAVESMSTTTARLYGYGEYIGDLPRPDSVDGVFGSMIDMRRTIKEVHPESTDDAVEIMVGMMRKNPCIRLDSGDIIWGCQCWWGPEDLVRSSIGVRDVVVVPVPECNKPGE